MRSGFGIRNTVHSLDDDFSNFSCTRRWLVSRWSLPRSTLSVLIERRSRPRPSHGQRHSSGQGFAAFASGAWRGLLVGKASVPIFHWDPCFPYGLSTTTPPPLARRGIPYSPVCGRTFDCFGDHLSAHAPSTALTVTTPSLMSSTRKWRTPSAPARPCRNRPTDVSTRASSIRFRRCLGFRGHVLHPPFRSRPPGRGLPSLSLGPREL